MPDERQADVPGLLLGADFAAPFVRDEIGEASLKAPAVLKRYQHVGAEDAVVIVVEAAVEAALAAAAPWKR